MTRRGDAIADSSSDADSARITPPANRLHFLDALRGLASISVVVYHFFGNSSPIAHHLLLNVENLGAIGVYTFFLVSGFIIPISLQRHATLWDFWRSRLFRLLPPYWFSIAVVLALATAGIGNSLVLHLGFGAYLANASMTAFLFRQPYILGVFWTLSIELVFYILCSALRPAKLLQHRFTLAFGFVCLYLTMLFAAYAGLLAAQHLKLEIGLVVAAFVGSAFYQVQINPAQGKCLAALLPLFLGTVLFAQFINYRHNTNSPEAAGFAWSFSVSWIIAVGGFTLVFFQRHRRFPWPLLWLGRVSYSLYLTHIIVGNVFVHFFSPGRYALPIAKTVCSLLVADLCYRFIERPSFAWARSRPRVADACPLAPIESTASRTGQVRA